MKHRPVKQHKYFSIKKSAVERTRRYCPRCVVEGTLIFTNPDFSPIEKLTSYQDIMGMMDKQKILKTFSRRYQGNLIKLKPRYLEEILITPEHTVLIAKSGKDRKDKIYLQEIMWKEAQDLRIVKKHKPGDYVIIPKLREEKTFVDFSSFIKRCTKTKLPAQPIELDEELVELMGWYVAEGYCSKKFLAFALSSEEKENIQKIIYLVKKLFGYSSYIKQVKNEKGIELIIHSRILPKAFSSWFGRGARNKHLPDFIMLARKNVVESFLKAYVKGDGRITKTGILSVTSVSKLLIKQLQLLFLKVGIVLGFSKGKSPNIICGRTVNPSEKYVLSGMTPKRNFYFQDENFFYFPLIEKKEVKYSGRVFNLETEENIYLIPFIVHNCGDSFLAKHKDRLTCGKCGLVEFLKS